MYSDKDLYETPVRLGRWYNKKGIEMNDNTNTKTEELVPVEQLPRWPQAPKDPGDPIYTQSQEQVGDESEVAA